MRLYNTIIVKDVYKGKTKFEFWKEMIPGDEIEVSVRVVQTSGASNGIYATMLRFVNRRTTTTFEASMTQSSQYLRHFTYEASR